MALNLGPLFQSIGDTGSQFAGAKLKAAEYRLQQIKDALAEKKEETSIEQMKQSIELTKKQIAQMGLAKPFTTVQGPTGEILGVDYAPGTGFGTKTIVAGRDMAKWHAMLAAMIPSVPKERQQLASSLADYYSMVGEPDKAVSAIKDLAVRSEQRPFSPEEQYIEAVVREGNGKPLTAAQLKKAHEIYQPYGAQKIQILQSNLSERQKQDLVNDIVKLETQTKGLSQIQRVAENVPEYTSTPSGPGDVALLLAFVEATKPTSGFRFTRAEQEMIKSSRGLIEGMEARIQAGWKGTLFEQGQREIIASIVRQASAQAAAKQKGLSEKFIKANPGLKDLVDIPETLPPKAAGGTVGYTVNGDHYDVPAGQEADFLKDFPKAKKD